MLAFLDVYSLLLGRTPSITAAEGRFRIADAVVR
jgi:hypothetical protein